MSVTATVMNIVRGSFHDGTGVRTVVYLKGCNLRCRWCHNPEGFSAAPQILYAANRCIHCGRCLECCPTHHLAVGDEHVYRTEDCTACGRCAEECPRNALELCGRTQSDEELFDQILRDRHYFETSGGGVTFSGGECLLQAEFVAAVGVRCREAGISMAVESAMEVPWASVERVLPVVDQFLVDVKLMDSEKHRAYIGRPNERILKNIRRLTQRHPNVLLRTPLIPGVNDDEENLNATADFARRCGDGARGWELLKYNPLGETKYALTQMPYEAFASQAQENAQMDELCTRLNQRMGRTDFVFYKK